MPLPLPNLDDRRWSDLVDEGRALIPRYAPGWTDHNVHDPGITLVELFAWLTELDVYGVNRVGARHRRKFLGLLGFAPLPPRPAWTMLSLAPLGVAPFVLPAGVELELRDERGAAVPFRTLRGITAAPITLDTVRVETAAGIATHTRDWRDGLPVLPFGADARPGAALYLGFAAIPLQVPITLAFRWQRDGATAAERAVQSASERSRLVDEAAAQQHGCRRPLPDIRCPGSPVVTAPAPALPPHHSARVVWETFTGAWTRLDPVAPPATPAPGQVADDTRALTLDGLVEINLPASAVATDVPAGSLPRVYLRCRLEWGAHDAPPVLLDVAPNAVPAEQSIALWQRFAIADPVVPTGLAPAAGVTTRLRMTLDLDGTIQALAFDPTAAGLPDVTVLDYAKAAAAPGHLTLEMVRAGVGAGLPDQHVPLPSKVVADDALRVFSHDGAAWQSWTLRPDFDASARADRHYTLDASTGTLTFGSGERGQALPLGHAVLVTARVTTAGGGNVAAGARARPRVSPGNDVLLAVLPTAVRAQLDTSVIARWPASGGGEAESLAHAAGRAAEALHAHARLTDLAAELRAETFDGVERDRVRALPAPSNAVDVLDLERLAFDVPGTRVARARAWASVHPDYPCLRAPGSVTVVILPEAPAGGAPPRRPQPSAGLLEAVRRFLDRRRPVATSLHVVAPRYLEVSVTARVQTRLGASAAAVKAAIVAALDAFLDPLAGGPDARGWPFGRDVYRAEILQVIDGVAGVDHVLDLTLSAPGLAPQCGNIAVCPTWLVAPGAHVVEVT